MATPEKSMGANPNPGANLSRGPVAISKESLLRRFKTEGARKLVEKIFSLDQESFDRMKTAQGAQSVDLIPLRERICNSLYLYSSLVAELAIKPFERTARNEGNDMQSLINVYRKDFGSIGIFRISPKELDTVLRDEARAIIEIKLGDRRIALAHKKEIFLGLDQRRGEFFPNFTMIAQPKEFEVGAVNIYEIADKKFLAWVDSVLISFGSSWSIFAASREINRGSMGALSDDSVLNRKLEEAAKLRKVIMTLGFNMNQRSLHDTIKHWEKWVDDNIPSLVKKSPEYLPTNSPEVNENTIEAIKAFLKLIIREAGIIKT